MLNWAGRAVFDSVIAFSRCDKRLAMTLLAPLLNTTGKIGLFAPTDIELASMVNL